MWFPVSLLFQANCYCHWVSFGAVIPVKLSGYNFVIYLQYSAKKYVIGNPLLAPVKYLKAKLKQSVFWASPPGIPISLVFWVRGYPKRGEAYITVTPPCFFSFFKEHGTGGTKQIKQDFPINPENRGKRNTSEGIPFFLKIFQ